MNKNKNDDYSDLKPYYSNKDIVDNIYKKQ
jgi:hypothetical protein